MSTGPVSVLGESRGEEIIQPNSSSMQIEELFGFIVSYNPHTDPVSEAGD